MEVWKDIKGYEGIYQVSSYGRVRNKHKILSPYTTKYGYKGIKLSKNGIKENFRVHRLVAMAFLDNPNNLPIINHKDENPSNNHVDNLEWCTIKYNNNYGHKNEKCSQTLKGKLTKSKNPNAKKVKCITTNEIFDTLLDASKTYNIYYESIILCCRGKRKSAGRHPKTNEKMVWRYYES